MYRDTRMQHGIPKSNGYHNYQQPNHNIQPDCYNQPSNMPMQMKHNGTYQAPRYCDRSPLAPLDNNGRYSDYRLENLDASSSSDNKNADVEKSNDMNNKENEVTQHANKSMPETSVAQMEMYEVGTVYSILLWENDITDMNEYDRNNEIYQILGDTYEGSQQLLAYLVDKQAGLLLWEQEEEADLQTPQQINVNSSLPAVSLLELFPQYGEKEDGKRLKKYFNSCKVAKLIAAHEYNRTRKRIPAERLNKLAEQAALLFPPAGPQKLWYQSAVTDNRVSHPSKGKLNRQNNEFSNVASGLRLFYSAEEPTGFDASASSATFNELKTIETVDESVEEKWLNIKLELEAYFTHTTITEIFESFPFLKTDAGLMLLLKHFDQKYPNLEGQFATKWHTEMKLILAKALQLSIDNKYCKPDIVNTMPDAGSQMALALSVMPLLMKPVVCRRVVSQAEKVHSVEKAAKNSKKNNKSSPAVSFHAQDTDVVALEPKNWTATKEEVCDSFVKQIEIINAGTFTNDEIEEHEQDQIHEHRQMLIAKYFSCELPLTAHVVIVGPITNIKKSILFIDNYSFEFVGANSTVRAAEACFKAIKLLGKEFPKAASAAWEYIQSNVLSMPVVSALQATTEFRYFLRTKYTPTPKGTPRPKQSKPTPNPGAKRGRKRKAAVGATEKNQPA